MKRPRVTMPKWPAYLMGGFLIACAYPAITAPAPVAESYGAAAAETRPALPPGLAQGADAIAHIPSREYKK